MKPDQERVRSLIADTVALLCRNGLNFTAELRIQAVIGVTIDKAESFVVHINKCFERSGQDDDGCANDEKLTEGLQQFAENLEEAHCQSQHSVTRAAGSGLKPTRNAPPCPNQQSSPRTSRPSVGAGAVYDGRTSPCGKPASPPHASREKCNCQSQPEMQMTRTASDNCPELKGSKPYGRNNNSPIYADSDECDEDQTVRAFSPKHSAENTAAQRRSCSGVRELQPKYKDYGQEPYSSPQYTMDDRTRQKSRTQPDVRDIDNCFGMDEHQQYQHSGSKIPRHSFEVWHYQKQQQKKQEPDEVTFDPCYESNMPAQHRSSKSTSSRSPACGQQQQCKDPCMPRSSVPAKRRRPMTSSPCTDSARNPTGKSYDKVTITRYVCNECQTSFGYHSSLLTHQIKKHGRQKKEGRGRPSKAPVLDMDDDDWC